MSIFEPIAPVKPGAIPRTGITTRPPKETKEEKESRGETVKIPMQNNEKRIMMPGPYLGAERDKIEVIAHRIDEDTPIVTLKTDGVEIHMSDVLAEDVVRRIERALDLLPTSK